MPVFRQLGDPEAGAGECLCQHHGVAYNEFSATSFAWGPTGRQDSFADGATILTQAITTTERCCIVVNVAAISDMTTYLTNLQIERPIGTTKTAQIDAADTIGIRLHHLAAWEVLNPGTYTYFLVNRAGVARNVSLAWMKIIASDCEG